MSSSTIENIATKSVEIISSTLQSTITTQVIKNGTTAFTQRLVHFSWIDYSFFILLLGISALIGVYYGFMSKHKQNNISEYILGGRSMSILPVATSLVASHVSGSTLLGLPVEVYSYGTQYSAFVVSAISVAFCLAYFYLPLFNELKMTSSFQYLERRFDPTVRKVASGIFVFRNLCFIPLVIYVPSLALSQVTGTSLHLITPIICSVCVFYTTIGGLRAVVWTDFIQFIIMLGAVFTVIVLGTREIGSFSDVWEAGERGGRIIVFNMDPSPFARTSFWTVSLGLTVSWISSMGVGQKDLQRFLSLPDLKSAKKSVIIVTLGMILIKFLALYIGLLVYAKYEHCDPVSTGIVKKTDEVLPYYVADVGDKIPGLTGLFIAGIFAAALSTMSSALNTLSGVIWDDVLRPYFPKATDLEASNIMKIAVVVIGAIVTGLVFIVERLGSVFQVGVTLFGLSAGPYLGIFTIGMISHTANSKGILVGTITSIMLVAIMLVGSQYHGISTSALLPTQTDGCLNASLIKSMSKNITVPIPENEIFWPFRISFMYYSLVGLIIMLIITQIVSSLTGGSTQEIDENLLISYFQSKKFKEEKKRSNSAKYKEVQQSEAIEMIKKTETKETLDSKL